LEIGFDAAEADGGGVCVQEVPQQATIARFNSAVADGDPEFAAMNSEVLPYGTLSHSHLNQILKNLRCEARGRVPQLCGPDGRFKMSLLQGRDPAFAKAAQEGLLWEVLSYKVQTEEPEGCNIIQAALNSKNGLFLVSHEMQAVLAVARQSTAVAERGLSMAFVRTAVAATLPSFADDPNFPDLFRFVIELGSQGRFVEDLRAFHEKFVNPRLRRLKLSSFGVVAQLPITLPFLKVAAVKWMYGIPAQDVKKGSCDVLHKQDLRPLISDQAWQAVAVAAEEALRFFHSDIAHHVATLPPARRAKVYGVLDRAVFGAILPSAHAFNAAAAAEELPKQVDSYYHKMSKELATSLGTPPFALGGPVEGKVGVEPSDRGGGNMLRPKVIAFDAEGKPTNRQDERLALDSRRRLEEYSWSEFLGTEEIRSSMRLESARCVLFQALEAQQSSWQVSSRDVRLLRAPGAKFIAAVAARDFQKGALRLAPLVPRATCILEGKSTAATLQSLATVKYSDGRPVSLAIVGAHTPPAAVAAPGAAMESTHQEPVTAHEWKRGHFLWPFWHIRTTSERQTANMVREQLVARLVTAPAPASAEAEAAAIVVEATFEVFKNAKAISAGEELLVFAPADKPSEPSSGRPPKTAKTWEDDARREHAARCNQPRVT